MNDAWTRTVHRETTDSGFTVYISEIWVWYCFHLQAVLDTCCDKPVLQYQPGPRRFHVAVRSDAIIVNSFLLTTIVGSWRDWERAADKEKDCAFDEEGGGVLGTLFRALHVLLRDDHPYREFNVAQLNRVQMVEALLLFCKVSLFNCNILCIR